MELRRTIRLLLSAGLATPACFAAAYTSQHGYVPIDLPQGIILGAAMLLGCRLAGEMTTRFAVTLFLVTLVACVVALLFVPIVGERTPDGAPFWYHERFEFSAYVFAISCGLVTILFVEARPDDLAKNKDGANVSRNSG